MTQTVTVTAASAVCSGNSVATPAGSNVSVVPVPGLNVQFSSVATAGNTCLSSPGPVLPAPPGFGTGLPADIFNLSTTANVSGTTQVCFSYDPGRYQRVQGLRLMLLQGGAWVDVTTSLSTASNLICGSASNLGTFAVFEERPTAISLRSFSAKRDGPSVHIQWTTASETDNWGFTVLRSAVPEGPYLPVNRQMIPARGGPGLSMTYHLLDNLVSDGGNYYYKLQDVDIRGLITEHRVFALLDSPKSETSSIAQIPPHSVGNMGDSPVKDTLSVKTAVASVNQFDMPLVLFPEPRQLSQATRRPATRNKTAVEFAVDRSNVRNAFRDDVTPRTETASRMTVADLMSSNSERSVPIPGDATAPGNVAAAFRFEVDIEDAQGRHVTVTQADEEGGAELVTLRSEGGAYQVIWRSSEPKVKGFMIYRRAIDGHHPDLAYEKVFNFVPNYAQNGQAAFQYQFTDQDAVTDLRYEYRVDTISWGISLHQPAEHIRAEVSSDG